MLCKVISSRKEKYMARINITRGAWATSFALETVPSDKILYVHLKVQDAIYLPQRKNNCLIELT